MFVGVMFVGVFLMAIDWLGQHTPNDPSLTIAALMLGALCSRPANSDQFRETSWQRRK